MRVDWLERGLIDSVTEDTTIDVFNGNLGDSLTVWACNKNEIVLLHYRKIILKCNRVSAGL